MSASRGLICALLSLWVHGAFGAAAVAAPTAANVAPRPTKSADTPLDRYLVKLATLRANFSQSLVDAHGKSLEALTGTLIVLRPGRFRWEVRPEAASGEATQLMVADGVNVWFYDRELEQVTVKPANAALTATPATLLSGTVELRSVFGITAAPRAQGMDWVLIKPLRADAEFREARIGFLGAELRRMVIKDKLGQTATFAFSSVVRNAPVSAVDVSFTPPPGVDVIGKPAG